MRCFWCAETITTLPENDPHREHENYSYFPAGVLEVLPGDQGGNGGDDKSCRCTVLCWDCFNKYEPDMWTCETHWNDVKPAVPFNKLPLFDHDDPMCEDYTHYENYQPGVP